ncbi:MAG: fused MFS/spermidine synthase [Chloroflexota bacterium]
MSVPLYARIAAFMAGFVGLGVELAAERMMAPAFGTTLDLWSVIIALTFAALSLGYELGGRYIVRRPDHRLVSLCLIAAGVWAIGIGFFGRTVAFWVQGWTFDFGGVTLGIFVTALLLITLPPFLLGIVTPAAIRLTVPRIGEAGSSSGTIFALSTVGSLLGTFAPVLLLMPFIGVRNTFLVVGAAGVVAGCIGLTSLVRIPAPAGEPASSAQPLVTEQTD